GWRGDDRAHRDPGGGGHLHRPGVRAGLRRDGDPAPRVPAELVGLAPPAAGARRGRVPGRRPRPAWVLTRGPPGGGRQVRHNRPRQRRARHRRRARGLHVPPRRPRLGRRRRLAGGGTAPAPAADAHRPVRAAPTRLRGRPRRSRWRPGDSFCVLRGAQVGRGRRRLPLRARRPAPVRLRSPGPGPGRALHRRPVRTGGHASRPELVPGRRPGARAGARADHDADDVRLEHRGHRPRSHGRRGDGAARRWPLPVRGAGRGQPLDLRGGPGSHQRAAPGAPGRHL
ncbi:MAG: Epoxide hydrolase, partial [uncultured Acidimicrobiales bacterium]